MQGLIGKKIGMTQVYDERGVRVPVTVVEAAACVVAQLKTVARDGYDAIQVGYGDCRESSLDKPRLGHLKKMNVPPRRGLREIAPDDSDAEVKSGDAVTVAIFEGVTHVDVIGITKGRGFAGLLKRHNMAGGPMTHGGHSKRRVGSIGQCSFPARVVKGQRMPGHMGHVRRTQQNLKIVAVRPETNVILIQGAVPGARGGTLLIRKARKKSEKAS